jgi:hypothetical protein
VSDARRREPNARPSRAARARRESDRSRRGAQDCPRCGKQFSTEHKAHLRACKGKKGGGGGGGGGRKRKVSAGSFVVGDGGYRDDGAYRAR